MGIFDEVYERVTSSQIGRQVSGALGSATSMLGGAAAVAGKFLPGGAAAGMAVSKAVSGDYLGAGLDVLRMTGIGSMINNLLHGKLATDVAFEMLPNPLYGGITPIEAARIVQEMQSTSYAKKNLYFVEITDFLPGTIGLFESSLFNLFCTSISLTPPAIIGDSHSVGSASIDSMTGMQRGEIRLTTLDDTQGSIKQWFATRKDAATCPDGTFGVPADYLVQIRILHAALDDMVMALFGGYEQKYICRPTSLETELTRTEDGLQEIQLSFSQFDTFMFDQST